MTNFDQELREILDKALLKEHPGTMEREWLVAKSFIKHPGYAELSPQPRTRTKRGSDAQPDPQRGGDTK